MLCEMGARSELGLELANTERRLALRYSVAAGSDLVERMGGANQIVRLRGRYT